MRVRLISLFSLTLSGAILCVAPPAVCMQAAAVPLSLTVTASPAEVSVGGSVTVVVALKNYKGDAVAVSEPLSVTLHSESSGDSTINFSPGQSSAQTTITFSRSGVATLTATAPKMSGGSVVVAVKAPASPTSSAAPSPAPSPAPSTGRSSAAAAAAGAQTVSLAVDVLPQHVHPNGAAWKAIVLVTAINDARQPVAVQADTVVRFATEIGNVSPMEALIKAGKARVTDTIQLTSQRPGNEKIWAWTDDNGNVTEATVEYHQAVPSQLLVTGLPSQVVNDGRTVVNVTVFLRDETAATAASVDNIDVKLTSSIGTPKPSTLSIPKGSFFAEAQLTSATSGLAAITATAPGLQSGSTEVRFVFPILLVVLAGVGGLIGSVVRSGRQMFAGAARAVWWHLVSGIGVGVVFGLLFYALALFGVVASIPKLSIPLTGIPTTNDLAAIVFGFFGGYYGRSWLPDPTNA